MEKKSLGRGLEDISTIFLSKSEAQQPEKVINGFSAVKMRDETCESCINFIVSHTGEQACKIFSSDHQKRVACNITSIVPIYANFCEYFNPVTLNTTNTSGKSFEERSKIADIPETECEIEETIRIERKIAYPNSGAGRENIRKTIFEYLEEGYTIQKIELRKTHLVSESRKKEKMDIEVTMFVRET